MKIVIPDATTLTNGDISLDCFNALGKVVSYPVTPKELTVERINGAEAVLCNKTLMTREVINFCPDLKYIGLFATGYNNIDMEAAAEMGITVCNAGEYSTMAVAQHVFALILEFYSQVSLFDKSVKDGEWLKSENFSYFPEGASALELCGKTLGIIGFGSIGKAVAKIGDAFGMKILINTRTVPQKGLYPYEFVSKEEVFEGSDIVTLHCPLTENTKDLVCAETLSLMKENAILINTSRGGTVREEDLAAALNSGKIRGAGLDVLKEEPMNENTPLRSARNCIITPHTAWAPKETRIRLIKIACDNLKAFIDGKPQNVVH